VTFRPRLLLNDAPDARVPFLLLIHESHMISSLTYHDPQLLTNFAMQA
jgi:hypothetical protein